MLRFVVAPYKRRQNDTAKKEGQTRQHRRSSRRRRRRAEEEEAETQQGKRTNLMSKRRAKKKQRRSFSCSSFTLTEQTSHMIYVPHRGEGAVRGGQGATLRSDGRADSDIVAIKSPNIIINKGTSRKSFSCHTFPLPPLSLSLLLL